MKLLSLIFFSHLLFVGQLFFREAVGATLTWTLPSQTRPLAAGSNTPTSTQWFAQDSPELHLKWTFTLTGATLFQVLWEMNDQQVARKTASEVVTVFTKYKNDFNISGSDPATLIVYDVRAADEVTFTCRVESQASGNWENNIKVRTFEPTRFIGYSGNKIIKENSNLTLFCNTTGKPAANITWTRVLDDGSDGEKMYDGNPWFIGNIKRTMNGTYRCTASNGFGNALTHSVHVNVTYPAGLENFQRELLVASFQNVTLQCPAEGNPPPKYTWSPCKEGGVCDEPKLNLGEVISDGVYTCSVTNSLGIDAENVTLFIAAKTVNVTLDITSENCTEGGVTSSVKEKLIKLIDTIFEASDLNYIGAEFVGYSCGSVTVYMALKFNSVTKEKDVIAKIRTAVMNGMTEGFTFDVSSITGTRIPSEEATRVPTSPTSSSKGIAGWIIAVIVVGLVLLIFLVVLAIFLKKKGPCSHPIKHGKGPRVHSKEGRDAEMEPDYSPVNNQYAAAGPNANYQASTQFSTPPPTYEVADRGWERKVGEGASPTKEPLAEYAAVDKTKKKKKPRKPGELQYAELGDLTGPGKKTALPRVSGTDTVYSDIRS